MTLYEQVLAYQCCNEQEERDREILLDLLNSGQDVWTRNNHICHLTASCWLTNQNLDKVLMCYHNIYRSYSWLGGHADGEKDLLKVALREAEEESGLCGIRPLSPNIISLEVLTVDGHVKRGEYVSSHLHVNVTYLLQADDRQPLKIREDENSALKWFLPEDAVEASTEEFFKHNIYPKLNERLRQFRKSLKKEEA